VRVCCVNKSIKLINKRHIPEQFLNYSRIFAHYTLPILSPFYYHLLASAPAKFSGSRNKGPVGGGKIIVLF
jgi:hypothetical protein